MRGLLSDCRRDAANARDDGSWQAVNAFARLERQLWLDLDEAERIQVQAQPFATREEMVAALRAIPADVLAEALAAADKD